MLGLPHRKVDTLRASAPGQPPLLLTYGRRRTRFPYITIIAQPMLLEFAASPTFNLRMRTRITGLVEGAIWLTLPLQPGDPEEGLLSREDARNNIFLCRRPEEWQIGVTAQRGSYRELRAAGIEAFRAQLAALLPEFAERLGALEWSQTALLSVELKRAERWHRDGLLLIGDAAHVMSPLGGVGINLAIRDAVLAANAVIAPLLAGRLVSATWRRCSGRSAGTSGSSSGRRPLCRTRR